LYDEMIGDCSVTYTWRVPAQSKVMKPFCLTCLHWRVESGSSDCLVCHVVPHRRTISTWPFHR